MKSHRTDRVGEAATCSELPSGAKRLQVFCPECGTQIYATAATGEPKVYGIRLGTARQRHQLPPKRQYWRRSALHWVDDIGSLPKFAEE
jgi:hypothetical protein